MFRQRTSIPLPLALALLLIPADNAGDSSMFAAGALIVAAGETLRLWAVHHIGAISRTRSDRLGPLVSTGPFAFVRNPLYIGNIALWVGFAVCATLVWLVPIFVVILSLEYHAIVRWEEELLESRLGDAYRGYAVRVPRWVPNLHHGGHRGHWGENLQDRTSMSSASPVVASFSWIETLFSERGTLTAIAIGYLLLWLKHHR